jgi:hypothetical protein
MSVHKWFLATSVFGFGALAGLCEPSLANSLEISCQAQQDLPSVVATLVQEKSSKQVTLLTFLPVHFSTQAATTNCQQTAKILQSLHETNNISYLTADILEQKSVVCTVPRRGLDCDNNSAEVLFSFADNTEPSQALYQMLGTQLKPSQPVVNRTLGRIYTKIEPPQWWEFWRI